MKKLLLLLLSLSIVLSVIPHNIFAAQYAPLASNRVKMNINREWKFKLGDHSGAQNSAYDDSSWSNIGLPHSFGIPYFMESSWYVGYGWYRKHLNIDPSWLSRRINIEFEAAFQVAEIYVNDTLVGTHKGGYTGFSFDITKYVQSGDNVVAIRLNNLWSPEIAPRAGEHNFNGGIYRNVYLEVTDPLHVTWYGTFATTPTISASSANVNMKTEIKNDSSQTKSCTVKTTIVDAGNTVVTSMQSSYNIGAGAAYTFDQTSTAISNPNLWSPESPYMYTAYTTVYDNGVPVDDYKTAFGMRWVNFTGDQGFFLNGKHVYLRGANVHQDHAGWGDAVTNTGIYRDVKMIKDCGMNFVRGSHYPHSPYFAEACDNLGVLFWSELSFWGSTMGPESGANWKASAYPPNSANQANFENNVKQQLKEMIRINRNHPSIIAWSMGNELFFTDYSVLQKTKDLVKSLVALSHTEDPTRLAGLGGTQRSGFDQLSDLAGYNGDGAKIAEYQNPGFPNLVAEYGSYVSDRPGRYNANFGDCQNIEYPWRSGQVLWCGFDHGSLQGDMGKMGMIDYFRLPKQTWYWYRNAYLGIAPPTWPTSGTASSLQLTADKTTVKNDGTDDCQLIVRVLDASGKHISNSPDVKLTIVSGPGQFPTGSSITFTNKDYLKSMNEGMAAIEFRSYYPGTTVIKATSAGLKDATITITVTGEGGEQPGSPTNGENLALEKTATADSSEPANPASNANDGNTGTRWCPTNASLNHWWKVDLGAEYNLTGSEVVWETANNYSYKIDVSADDTNWTTVVDKTGSGQTNTDSFTAKARYVRITGTGLPTGCYTSFYEFKVFGSEIKTPVEDTDLTINRAAYHPVKSSSEQPANPGDKGNDGSGSTRWCASSDNTGEWWQIDLESFYYVYGTSVTFESAKNYRYMIQVSEDQTNWVTIVDQTNNTSSQQVRQDSANGARGRFIRIVYTGLPSGTYASHYEFEVYASTAPVTVSSAFSRIEAENYSSLSSTSIQTADTPDGGKSLAYVENGNCAVYGRVDFGNGADLFKAQVATTGSTSIEIRLGSTTGTLIGTLPVASTGGWNVYQEQSCVIDKVTGIKDVYLVFKGAVNFDCFSFSGKADPSPVTLGDLNSDGEINSVDFLLMKKHILELETLVDPACADLDGNGAVNTVDMLLLKQYLLGVITEFPG